MWEECRPCPVFASYTLAFALQLRKKQGKTSVTVQYTYYQSGYSIHITSKGTVYILPLRVQYNYYQ